MPDVIELRVHGVGGSPPEGLLGVAAATDCVQVAGDGETAFVARRDDLRVQGYLWGGLTERPLLQPLWLFLLPFTLVNVAGWMHPPIAELRGGRRAWLGLFRGLVLIVGAVFTSSYFTWVANFAINRLYHGQTFLHFAWGPRARVAVGGAVVLVVVVLVRALAGVTQRRFERFSPPDEVAATRRGGGIEDSLADPSLWYRVGYCRRLLGAHTAVAVGSVAAITAYAWIRASIGDPRQPGLPHALRSLGIAPVATYTTEVALWAIVALALVQLLGWERRPRGARRFRWLGPATAATTGVAYGTMILYSIPLLFGAHSAGRIAVLASSFGAEAVALAATGAGLFVWFLRRSRRERRQATSGSPPFAVAPNPPNRGGDEPRGATEAIYARIARSRTVADAGANATAALSVPALVFLAAALYQFRFGPLGWLGWTVRFGEVAAAGGTGALLAFLIRNARKPNERRIVGIIWDVLTFWPRRFHPFAVRPYAERAVPELQTRLVRLVRARGERVVLSCHSQGTALGYAALVQIPDDVLREVAFVTYGSPLRQLYEMTFPAYFDRAGFEALRRRLFDDGREPSPSWRVFYRLTDYIGTTVFDDPALEVVVPDPAEEPLAGEAPLTRPFVPAFPDTPRTPWVELALHSYYNREPLLKGWLRELRARMEDRAAPPGERPGQGPDPPRSTA